MTAFLFPGQGSQQAGIASQFHEAFPETHPLFATAERILSALQFETMMTGDQATLNDTRNAQPALVCVETAITVVLKERGVVPTVCAGHSLGEISALVAAGGLPFAEALRLVQERARLMSENVAQGGMAAVLGLDADAIRTLLPETVQVANYNGPAQTIISGSREGLETAVTRLKEAGAKRVLPLPVSGPFHSQHMEPAREALARFLQPISLKTPETPFLSSVSGAYESDPDRIARLLSEQLCSPVQWTRVMEHLAGTDALEIGPGTVLQGLAKRMMNGLEVHAAGTPDACLAYVQQTGALL